MSYRQQNFNNAVNKTYECLYHHSDPIRLMAIKNLMKNLNDFQKRSQNYKLLKECLADRINDNCADIVMEVLKLPTTEILEIIGVIKLVESLVSILHNIQKNPRSWGKLSINVVKHLTNQQVIEQYDNNLILLTIMPVIFPADCECTFYKTIEEIVGSPLASTFTFLERLQVSEENFNVATYKRHFLNVISECHDNPTAISLLKSVELQGRDYFKQALQVCHFLILITASLKDTYSAQESLQIFKLISGYVDKFQIRRLEKQETKTINPPYIPIQLFSDFLINLIKHTNCENLIKLSWEDSTALELHYFLNVFEFVTEKCFRNYKDSGNQTEWSTILKTLFDTVFKDPYMKANFLVNFYVYDKHAAVKNYTVLRMRAFKLMQDLLTNGKGYKLKLDATHILKMCIALISSSEDFRLEALASLKVLLIETTALEGALQFFVKSVLDRWEEIAMCCEEFPLVLYSLLKCDIHKKQNAEMGPKMLRTIMDLLTQDVTFAQFGFIKELLRLIIHIDDLDIIKKLEPFTYQALKMYSMDHGIKHLNEPYASFIQLVCDRFNVQTVSSVFLENPSAWKLIEAIFQNYMVFLTQEGNLKPVPCVFLESFDEYAYGEMPSKYKQQFLHLIVKTLAVAENGTIFLATKKLLKRCQVDCRNFGEIVESMYKSCVNSYKSHFNSRTAKKRYYTIQSSQVQTHHRDWKQGIALMQLLENKKKLKNTSILIPPLFELLNCCLKAEEPTTVEYTKQLVLSVLLNFCHKAEESSNLPKFLLKINIDLIVQCLHASQNAQTHYSALLLLSYCAGIFPQQLLHHIREILIFMGSSRACHIDSISVHIMNNIIVAKVPILVQKKSSIPVLKVFSEMILDYPDHRHLPLYTKLLLTLGAEQHLWKFLCLFFEAHVIDYQIQMILHKKPPETEEIEIALVLTNTFSLQIVFETCIQLMKYIIQLPMQNEDRTAVGKTLTSADNAKASLFVVSARTEKQLRHYKYVIMKFLSAVTSSNEFRLKVAFLTDDEILKMKPYYKNYLIHILSFVSPVTAAAEIAHNTLQKKFWEIILDDLHDVLENIISLLPAPMFMVVVNGLLQHQILSIRKQVIKVLLKKLQQKDHDLFDTVDSELLHNLLMSLDDIVGGILKRDESAEASQMRSGNELSSLQESVLIVIALLSKLFAINHMMEFKEILTHLTRIAKHRSAISNNMFATVVLTMVEISLNFKAHSIAYLPKLMRLLTKMLQEQVDEHQHSDLACAAIVTGMQKLFETLPLFLGPYIVKIIIALSLVGACIGAQNNENKQGSSVALQSINSIWPKIATEVSLRILASSCGNAYANLMSTRNYAAISLVMKLLHQAIVHAECDDLIADHNELAGIFMQVLEFRFQIRDYQIEIDVISNTESSIMDAFVALALKLSERSFRPLYHKLYNWTLQHEERKEIILTYFLLSHKISVLFKSLFVLFASDFIEYAARVLNNCKAYKFKMDTKSENLTPELLRAILNTLHNIFLYESKKFLNSKRFEYIMPAIVDNLENCLVLKEESLQQVLKTCIGQLATAVSNDVLWKRLNYHVLNKTYSNIPKVRIFALNCCVEIARKLGPDFKLLLPQTVPFIADLFKDEDLHVKKNTRKSQQELEDILGETLKKYF